MVNYGPSDFPVAITALTARILGTSLNTITYHSRENYDRMSQLILRLSSGEVIEIH